MEAKDYRFNLLLCLDRFKAHVTKFRMVEWKGRTFRIFLFGDYEFLCAMYELSDAAGKHPCLWCTISSGMLVIPLSERGRSTPRTLDSLTENYKKFRGEFNGNTEMLNFASTSLTQGFLKSHYPMCAFMVYILHWVSV